MLNGAWHARFTRVERAVMQKHAVSTPSRVRFACYVIEYSLSVDNLFVFIVPVLVSIMAAAGSQSSQQLRMFSRTSMHPR